jgi:arsenate reductase (glutaredoxin)
MAAARTITVYGIPNCDTVKKARTWLEAHGVAFAFHDFKKAGVNAPMLEAWLAQVPLDTLVNRRGTTWRALDDARKAAAETPAGAIALMLDKPSVIKRPVLVIDTDVAALGFDEARYRALFAA